MPVDVRRGEMWGGVRCDMAGDVRRVRCGEGGLTLQRLAHGRCNQPSLSRLQGTAETAAAARTPPLLQILSAPSDSQSESSMVTH